MQIWQPGYDVREDGDYAVTLNPGSGHPFAIITLSEDSRTALVIQSPEEAARLVKAAVRAERMLLVPQDDAWRLTAKGEAELPARIAEAAQAGLNPPHHATGYGEASCGAEDDNYICTAQEHHDGPLHIAYGSHGEVCHRWPVAAAPAHDETPAAVA